MTEENKEIENENPAEELEIVVEGEPDDPLSTDAPQGSSNSGSESKGSESGKDAQKAGASEEDELAEYSEGVKKRIAKLTGKMREAERREQAALEYAQSVKAQLEEQSKRANVYENSHFNEYKSRLDHQDAVLKIAMREAIERGDTDKQVEIQTALAQFAVERQRYAQMDAARKAQMEAAQRAAQQPVQQPQAQAQAQQPPARPDPKAEAWAERNKWFGQDEPMTLTAFSHHKSLVENEGFDPTSDEYYRELDRRIRNDFPHKFQEQAGKRPNMVAPANGRASAPGAKSKTQIKLSPSQVAIAKKLGVSLEQYARQVAALQKTS